MTASVHTGETVLFSVLLQLIVMIGAARLFGRFARAIGQPGVVGEIIAGLALGPSLFGYFLPGASAYLFSRQAAVPIGILSQIGLTLLMFQIGADFDFGQLREGRRRGVTGLVALVSIIAPLLLGCCVGLRSAPALAPGKDPFTYSLFCGVAIAITAVPILGRILREFDLAREPIGVIAISAAAINDVCGWLLLAGISAYATSSLTGWFVVWRAALLVGGVVVFRIVLQPMVDRLHRMWPVRNGHIPPNLMAAVFCLIFSLSLFTNSLGIFTIFGGFAAGILFYRHTDFVAAWHGQVGQFVLVFFLPIFFTSTGLRTSLLGLSSPADIAWLAAILAVSILGKIVPVYTAGRVCRLGHWQSLLLGSLMNTRALMELIVLNIGYDLGVLPQKPFTMLVVMAVATTVMTGPLLRLVLPRLGLNVSPAVHA
jgi:Kef-type K+ transport system membrane component KefB